MNRNYIEKSQAKQIDDTHIEVDGVVYSLCDHTTPSCTCDRSHEMVGMTRKDFEALSLQEKIAKIKNTDTFKEILDSVNQEINKSQK